MAVLYDLRLSSCSYIRARILYAERVASEVTRFSACHQPTSFSDLQPQTKAKVKQHFVGGGTEDWPGYLHCSRRDLEVKRRTDLGSALLEH